MIYSEIVRSICAVNQSRFSRQKNFAYGKLRHTICNAAELNARVTEHFSSQFSDPSVEGLNAFTETLSRLTHRITPVEIKRAIGKLNSGRTSGHDDGPAELFKCSADLVAQPIANIFNDALEHDEPPGLGKGVLILIQKPGNPKCLLTIV